MPTLRAPQAETLWDEVLPIEAKELPEDLGKIDELLGDPKLLRPIATHWEEEASETGRAMLSEGRPTIAMETYVRLMVLKQRTGWGYETLVKEVSDSIHLRRFCLIPLHERVPCESTVRKLTRRLGAETVAELTRALIAKAQRERRFRARAARIDSTVVEADVRYPTDSGLAADGVKVLAREARKMLSLAGKETKAVRDRSRALGKRLRAMSRTLARRSGERKAEVLRLTGECGELLRRSVGEARRLATVVKGRARGRSERASRATRPSSATSSSSASSPPRPSRVSAAFCCPPPRCRAPRTRTSSCRRPSPSSPAWGSARASSPSTAASATSVPTSSSPRSRPSGPSSPVARSRGGHGAPNAAWPATGSGPRVASPTSSGATGCGERG